MTIWISGGGTLTKDEEAQCFREAIVPLDAAAYDDFSAIHSFNEVKTLVRQRDAEAPPETLDLHASGLWRFIGEMQPDDIVVLPLLHHGEVMLATLNGPYRYVADAPERLRHRRHTNAPVRVPLKHFTRRVPLVFSGNAMWYAPENGYVQEKIRALGGVAMYSFRAKVAGAAMVILLLFALFQMMASSFGW